MHENAKNASLKRFFGAWCKACTIVQHHDLASADLERHTAHCVILWRISWHSIEKTSPLQMASIAHCMPLCASLKKEKK